MDNEQQGDYADQLDALAEQLRDVVAEVPAAKVSLVAYVDSISDTSLAGHCMLHVATGITYHSRLGLLIVEKGSLHRYSAVHLP